MQHEEWVVIYQDMGTKITQKEGACSQCPWHPISCEKREEAPQEVRRALIHSPILSTTKSSKPYNKPRELSVIRLRFQKETPFFLNGDLNSLMFLWGPILCPSLKDTAGLQWPGKPYLPTRALYWLGQPEPPLQIELIMASSVASCHYLKCWISNPFSGSGPHTSILFTSFVGHFFRASVLKVDNECLKNWQRQIPKHESLKWDYSQFIWPARGTMWF